MNILIIAEHDSQQLKSTTLNTVSAANQLSAEITLLIIGSGCNQIAEQASKIVGIKKVLLADHEVYQSQLAENLAPLVVKLAKDFNYILAPASTFGKDLMPRIAALLDVAQISEITGIESKDTFIRPIYAGNAFEKVQSFDHIKVITIRTSAFSAAKIGDSPVVIEKIEDIIELRNTELLKRELTQSKRPELTAARVIISGGRGLQSAENFKLLEKLADILNAAIGASRAAVDAGFVPNDYQVGQTGKVVAPELYIAIGISGAIQHLAGMKDSKVIVAINKDPEAPIFEIADYGLVGDLFEIVPELTNLLTK